MYPSLIVGSRHLSTSWVVYQVEGLCAIVLVHCCPASLFPTN
jgi:hypothetical protein